MAVSSTPLGTTVQLALGQEFWAGEGSLWRVQLLGCAEKQGNAWQPTSSCVIWTLQRRMLMTAEGWQTVYHSLVVVQLAVDTTLVSPVRGGGQLQRGASDRDGVALKRARRKKETTYPELVRPVSRARSVVLALAVGGRWSQEACTSVQLLAQARARSEPPLTSRRMALALVLGHFLCCRASFCRITVGTLWRSRGLWAGATSL